MAVRRQLYLDLGGLCEGYPSSFNGIHFSFKALRAGYRNVVADSMSMCHFESLSFGPSVSLDEISMLISRWPYLLGPDPYARARSMSVSPKKARRNAAIAAARADEACRTTEMRRDLLIVFRSPLT